jgi:predicted DNA-binding helix-hairpin-helix protein
MNLTETPVEINRAGRRELLRVPGIGLKGADAIIQARRNSKLRDVTSLHKLGIIVVRAVPFLLLDGRRPEKQLSMF